MTIFPYVAIEGVIGVGKTTLARYLKEALSAQLLLEVFEENPFLTDFYADRSRYAFQTQIFFLLSRYRQQHQVIPQAITRAPLVSDYLFAKDNLFANLNLVNDELAVYGNVYAALAERIPPPRLVVYLKAGVDTLMERIAVRDRPYERDMDRAYIAALHQAYEAFFAGYTAPCLTIATDGLNIVQDASARQAVVGEIKNALSNGATQAALPLADMDAALADIFEPAGNRRLTDFQRFHQALDQAKDFPTDLYLNYMLLVKEVGELGAEVAHLRRLDCRAGESTALLGRRQEQIKLELADCLAYLIKLANYTGVNLEEAYLEKMNFNVHRAWPQWSHSAGEEAEA